MQITANRIQLEYEEYGSPDGVSVILVCGQSDQLISWPDTLISGLCEDGYRVIVFDNRDSGLSQKFPTDPRQPGDEATSIPGYTVDDMSADLLGLMDVLNIRKTHVIGSSMGGVISLVASKQAPDRFLTATILMAGMRTNGSETNALKAKPCNLEEFVASKIAYNAEYGGTRFRKTRRETELLARRQFQRAHDPAAGNRQLLVVSESMQSFAPASEAGVPVLIIVGTEDRIIPPTAAQELADRVSGARIKEVAGMGHTLSDALIAEVLPDIRANIRSPARLAESARRV